MALINKIAKLVLEVDDKGVVKSDKNLNKFTTTAKNVERASDGLRRSWKGAAGAATALGGAIGVTAVIQRTVSDYNRLQTALKNVKSISNQSEEQFRKTSRALLEFAAVSGDNATDAANALYQAISAGVSENESIDFLKQASQTAKAGAVDLSLSVDGLTNVINAYKLEISETEKVSDSLLTTVKLGKTTFAELSANMSKATVPAANLGITYNELLASIAQITKLGTGTAEAFTQQKALITSLVRPSESLAEAYEQLGIESAKAFIEQEGYFELVKNIAEEYKGQDAALVKALGSTEAYAALLATTGENGKDVVQTLKDIENGVGQTAKAADAQSGTWERAMERMKNASLLFFDNLESKFGVLDKFTGLINAVSQEMTAAATGISSEINRTIAIADATEGKIEALLSKQEQLKERQQNLRDFQSEASNPLNYINPNSPINFLNFDPKIERARKDFTKDRFGLEDLSKGLEAVNRELESLDQAQVTRVESARAFAEAELQGDTAKMKRIDDFLNGHKQILDSIEQIGLEGEKQLKAEQELHKEKLKTAETILKEKETTEEIVEEKKELTSLEKTIADLTKSNEEFDKRQKERQKQKVESKKEELGLTTAIKNVESSGGRTKIPSSRTRTPRASRFGSFHDFGRSRVDTVRESAKEIAEIYQTEEERLQDTYERRKNIILNSTELTMREKADVISRMDEEINRRSVDRTWEATRATLNVSADFLGNLSSLVGSYGKKGFEASKALAIASTTISTFQNAVEAYKSTVGIPVVGPYLAPIAAASAVAFGLAQIQQIRSQQYRGYTTGGIVDGNSVTGDNVLIGVNSGEMVLNQSQQTKLFNEIVSGSNKRTGNIINNIKIENSASNLVEVSSVEQKENPVTKELETRILINRIEGEFASKIARGQGPLANAGKQAFGDNRGKR